MIRGLSALTALLARALSVDLPACVPSRRTEKKTYLSIYIRRQGARRIARANSANSANRSAAIGEARHIAQVRAGTGGVPGGGPNLKYCQSLKGCMTTFCRTHRARTRGSGIKASFGCHHFRADRAHAPAHLWGSMQPVSRARNEGFQWLAH